MPNVTWKRPELKAREKQYRVVRDCVEGSIAVKTRRTLYLPAPNPGDKSKANLERYNAYLTRAVFYNVTARTRRGFVGQIFARTPEIKVPTILTPMIADMNGLGINAVQQIKSTTGDVIEVGRAGLFSDFPTLPEDKPATVADVLSGKVRPSITVYAAEQIINWDYVTVNGENFYTLIVLEEKRRERSNDGFSFTDAKQWRVLRLDAEGFFIHEVYRDDKSAPTETYRPRWYDGNRLDYIPFEFCGAEENTADVDPPPLFDLADLNLGHYRNSADYEELTYMVGQPTPVYTGLTQQWVDDNFKDKDGNATIYLGSTSAVPLPQGGSASLLQAEANQLAEQAMERKERQMIALGAKLAETNTVQKTATQSAQENAAESSQLETIADNVAVAYAQAMGTCLRFVAASDQGITLKLNTAFEVVQMDAASRAQLIKEWQQGAISFTEMRAKLRSAGIASQDDTTAKGEILEEERQRAALNPDPAGLNDPQGDGEE